MTRRSLFAAIAGVFGAKAVPTTVKLFHGAPTAISTADLAAKMANFSFSGMPFYVNSHLPPGTVILFNLKNPDEQTRPI